MDMDGMRASKRRKFASSLPARAIVAENLNSPDQSQMRSSSEEGQPGWNLEQAYEQRTRISRSHTKSSTRLPIKNALGQLEHVEDVEQEIEQADTFGTSNDNLHGSQVEHVSSTSAARPTSAFKNLMTAKEELARIASQIIEDPEEHVGGLRSLARISESSNAVVKKLGLATQMSVYRDIIPGYRIRSGIESDEKLSKEIRKLRNFEQSLLTSYQLYLKDLLLCATPSTRSSVGTDRDVASMAIVCACSLLLAVPHFNFRSELIKIIIDKLASPLKDADFNKCLEALACLFQNDEDGSPSLEGVSMLSKMIKSKHYRIDEEVLSLLLHLRLLSEFSSKASRDHVDGPEPEVGQRPLKKKEFRTKKQRKLLKEQQKIDKEFKEADAIVDSEHRNQMQAEILKLVFSLYFRILKTEERRMVASVLEGLAKYAHLINQDFFGDLVEVLKDLVESSEKSMMDMDEVRLGKAHPLHHGLRSLLLCASTAFALLEGQDVAKSAPSLGLDLSYFINLVYRNLHLVALDPDLELSGKGASSNIPGTNDADLAHEATSSSPTLRVNVQRASVLFLRAITAALGPRLTPPIRLAAFTKSLSTASLHLPEKSTSATMALLNSIAKTHTQKIAALWNTEERKGDGKFDPERADFEVSNPFAATIWEGELLRYHFSPSVRDSNKSLTKITARIT